MPHDIIENRTSFLGDAVRPLLGQSERAHFAVGYFFLSGFKAIAQELEKVQEVRLLIGNTSDRATVEQLAEGHASKEAILAKQRDPQKRLAVRSPPAPHDGPLAGRSRADRCRPS